MSHVPIYISRNSVQYAESPCWLYILYIVVCTCSSQAPDLSSLPCFPFCSHTFIFNLFMFCLFFSVHLSYKYVHFFLHFLKLNFTYGRTIYLSFSVWHTPHSTHSMIISRSIHVATNGIISFFLMAEKYFIVCIYHIFVIRSSVDRHLGCFYVLVIVNSAAMNIVVHVSFWRDFSLIEIVGII